MSIYKNILVAIDPFINSNNIIEKAKKLVDSGDKIQLVHVMDVVVIFPNASTAPPLLDLPGVQRKTQKQARDIMLDIGKKYAIPAENIHNKIGSTAKVIKKFAAEIDADLIVVGSHGRHGIGLLLGSTASSVVHGAPCDMLVVRIKA